MVVREVEGVLAGRRGEVRNSVGSCSEGSESLEESSSMRACWDIFGDRNEGEEKSGCGVFREGFGILECSLHIFRI